MCFCLESKTNAAVAGVKVASPRQGLKLFRRGWKTIIRKENAVLSCSLPVVVWLRAQWSSRVSNFSCLTFSLHSLNFRVGVSVSLDECDSFSPQALTVTNPKTTSRAAFALGRFSPPIKTKWVPRNLIKRSNYSSESINSRGREFSQDTNSRSPVIWQRQQSLFDVMKQ